jgi:carbonic anhydrase
MASVDAGCGAVTGRGVPTSLRTSTRRGTVNGFRTHRLLAVAALFAASIVAQKTPDDVLARLQTGNARFVAGKSLVPPLGDGVRRTLTRGDNPWAIVLCCADSRVAPEHVFNTGLGDLFVVRLAGNSADDETIASIEYAADQLGAPLCVVLGHEGCGAVQAAVAEVVATNQGVKPPAPSQALATLLETIEPSVRKAMALELGGVQLTDKVEEEHAQHQVAECLRRSPVLRTLQKLGRFRMVAARYHLQSGEVEFLPPRPLPAPADVEVSKAAETPPTLPPHVALQALQAGNRRFLADGKPIGDISPARRDGLSLGQHPFAVVVTCADGRVVPEHLFDAGLGEIFVVRLAGTVCTEQVIASVEYAVEHLGASLVLVMGHDRCEPVRAALAGTATQTMSSHQRALLAHLEPAVEAARATGKTGDALLDLAIRMNVQRSLAELRSRSALLREHERAGTLLLQPALYDLGTGEVEWLKATAATLASALPAPTGETHVAETHGKASADHRVDTPPAPNHVEVKPADVAATAPPIGETHAPTTVAVEPPPDAMPEFALEQSPLVPWRKASAPPRRHTEMATAPPVEPQPTPNGRITWPLDATTTVVGAGVVSLLLAGLLAMRRRGG